MTHLSLRRLLPAFFSGLLLLPLTGCALAPLIPSFPSWTSPPAATRQPASHSDTPRAETPDRYAWSLLTASDEQDLYLRICAAVADMAPTLVVTGFDSDTLVRILDYVRIDYPEYFWFNGADSLSTRTIGGVVQDITVNLSYNMTTDQLPQAKAAVEDAAQDCLSAIDSSWSDYDKIKAVYDWVIRRADYDGSVTDQSLYSVMTQGRGVCAGYARATQYLLQSLDIPCTYITGYARGGSHAWNLVEADGEDYYLDPTWGDPVFTDGSSGDPNQVSYGYFCVTTDVLLRTHTIDDTLPVPQCTATSCNYYVHNGLSFSDYDLQALTEPLIQTAQSGAASFSFQFTNADAYAQAVSSLFNGQEVFSLLDQAASSTALDASKVRYSTDDTLWVVTIRLQYH